MRGKAKANALSFTRCSDTGLTGYRLTPLDNKCIMSTFSGGGGLEGARQKLATTKKQPEPDDIHLSDKLSLNTSLLKLPDSQVSKCFNSSLAAVEVCRVIAR